MAVTIKGLINVYCTNTILLEYASFWKLSTFLEHLVISQRAGNVAIECDVVSHLESKPFHSAQGWLPKRLSNRMPHIESKRDNLLAASAVPIVQVTLCMWCNMEQWRKYAMFSQPHSMKNCARCYCGTLLPSNNCSAVHWAHKLLLLFGWMLAPLLQSWFVVLLCLSSLNQPVCRKISPN